MYDTMTLLAIAALNAFTAYMGYRTHAMAINTDANIQRIEVATNSMKDALVESTAVASHAAGELKGRADQKAENSIDIEKNKR